MSDHLEDRLNALADTAAAPPAPASLLRAAGAVRRQRLASAGLLCALLLSAGVLAFVALRQPTPAPVTDGGIAPFVQAEATSQTIASLRTLDPALDSEFPGENTNSIATITPVRLLPLRADRIDSILRGDL